ncbi:MAG: ArsR/SmtB family transcription factor [Solirubrobacteraceae bacterium]
MGHATQGMDGRRSAASVVASRAGVASPAGVDVAKSAGVASETAERVAQTMQALATASRVRLLAQLRAGPHTVGELAAGAEMEQSAVSHQLRVLRHLGLVTGRRTGRNVLYALHDQHVARLLSEAIGHAEHVELGITDSPGA